MGVSINWIVPYKYTQKMPFDVDYSVMNTFCEFYTHVQKFINFKLFSAMSLEYPPKRDQEREFDYAWTKKAQE